ncbi:MAG: 2-amino-4-hydroxy-6-hydroxymethyldihydropteridine diphosphokinase [Nitrosomonadaceae bacterium]|nr:2-amino-4-hydroxy-6-hydroxymethyldihydropteridine diphosphokinase [Nitrosospira sp.]MDW7642112.1 2-amino-4-hydroxy-6-hydroxymethyldihydropteridine diphosphokinase [Nitrosomonadaceae bacterium]MDW7652745.1 2-amino-4-hydroxy-6-hydroxymethyldihydropteridine diphosphokinase [Nitrosomonadaceae bacterium]MDW7664149.1 2-amino-4-hydroxy-6-hydroxymethyldihydropteridine diphosphokinase [Nitrosomonadaceae bacterium]MDW7665090.1 2-amino-4-hydroxy-6-hydroxymethyldihydropteridine diphosphokinase [Nitrosom
MLGSKPRSMCHVFIALGSNLEDPALQVRRGLTKLTQLPRSRLLIKSSLYRSAPIGEINQPDFVNAVAKIETNLAPHNLLESLLKIEQQQKRIRIFPNGPRTLDLDILLYGNLECHEHFLILPHPRMHQRAFVLWPLMEIEPNCHIPGHGPVAKLLAKCLKQKIRKE